MELWQNAAFVVCINTQIFPLWSHRLLKCDAKWLEYYPQNTVIFSLNYIDWKWARVKNGVGGKQMTACSGTVEMFRSFCLFQTLKFVKPHLKVG